MNGSGWVFVQISYGGQISDGPTGGYVELIAHPATKALAGEVVGDEEGSTARRLCATQQTRER